MTKSKNGNAHPSINRVVYEDTATKQQKIENEVPTTTSTIQRQENIQPEVEVTIKPETISNSIPRYRVEYVSTAIEVGIDGSSAVDDIRGPEERKTTSRCIP